MRPAPIWMFLVALIFATCVSIPGLAQADRGSITGFAADTSGGALPAARITVDGLPPAFADGAGQFVVSGVKPGSYTLTVSYVGFQPFTATVVVEAGKTANLNAVLKVISPTTEITVYAGREHGEVAAINRQRAAENIVQILPDEVITSLPNANIADALGRLPSVTLERDEGEGKYVQVRGTEPRLTNVTIDGINVPSPESGVRQIKLDSLAAGLVEAVEINKTLQANMDADGIGGSVNLRTKTADNTPTLNFGGMGGYTPILGGRGVDQYDLTTGQRFGAQKKFGILFGATYDYEGRGINDIEPSPTPGSASPHYDSIDLRDYKYYRQRWGLAGSSDYRLGQDSSIYLRGLYSTFKNWGDKTVYTLNDGGKPAMSEDWRRPDHAIASLVMGGKHVQAKSWFSWDASVARARTIGGSGGAKYKWNGGTPNCADDPTNTVDVYRPQFSAGCFTAGTSNALDPANYKLSSITLPGGGLTAQVNLQGSASYARRYHIGSHAATFEFGGKVRNGHKFDDTYSRGYNFNSGIPTISGSNFIGATDPGYYNKSYQTGPFLNFNSVQQYVASHPSYFSYYGTSGPNSANYDLVERVAAGYMMNTVDLTSRLHLVTGVRFENTQVNTRSFAAATGGVTFLNNGSYLDVLPSASLRIAVTKESGFRVAFSRGLSRPNPQDITAAVSIPDFTQNPVPISMGNPNLKAEHAYNYDLLYEHYLKPHGLFQAGFFYKSLSDPIIATQTRAASLPNEPALPPGQYYMVSQPGNAGSAYLAGFEASYQQRMTFLPGPMKALGLSANYSYTASQACGIPNRTDCPALLRQAPHTWNISPTYDRGRVSIRVGASFNAANIFAYQWTTGADSVGIKGPSGDNYLYPHMQLDAQGSVRVYKGLSFVASALNLTNEVFGFYNGSPQYVVQREYYQPTYAFGFRYRFSRE